MGSEDSKKEQLRVRVTAEDREHLEKLRTARGRGVTISDLVREAISLFLKNGAPGNAGTLPPKIQTQVERLAELLKREPQQVEEACIQGIFDMIESKCDVPLIVMETHLHMKYRNRESKEELPWSVSSEHEQKQSPPAPTSGA